MINFSILKDFDRYNRSKGLAEPTIDIQGEQMRLFEKQVKKPFKDVTRRDIEQFLNWMHEKVKEKQRYSKATIEHQKQILKKFFKWFYERQLDKDIEKVRKQMELDGKSSLEIDAKEWELRTHRMKYPMVVDWIKYQHVPTTKTENDVISPDVMKKMIDYCQHPQFRAILSLLWDCAMREGQLCSITIGDLIIHDGKIDIVIEMDDGEKRTIPTVDSTPALFEWLKHSVYREQPDKPFFYSLSNRSYGKRYTSLGIYQLVVRTAKRAGITKHVYPHLIRHSRCTFWKKTGLDSATIKHIGLWKMHSNIPDTVYNHQTANDYRNDVLRSQGIEPIVKPENYPLRVNYCRRCGEPNDPTNPYCAKCREPLTEYALREYDLLIKSVIQQQIQEMIQSQWYKSLTQPEVNEYITPDDDPFPNMKITAETPSPEMETPIDQLLKKYLSDKQEFDAIKTLGLKEWGRRKRLHLS
jgi:integrase